MLSLKSDVTDSSKTKRGKSVYNISDRELAENSDLELRGTALKFAILSENHFKKRHKEEVCRLVGFHTFRRDRKGRGWGGVVIYVQDQLKAREHLVLSLPDHIELLWVEARSSRG